MTPSPSSGAIAGPDATHEGARPLGPVARLPFTPTRAAGLERLRAFVPDAGVAYAQRRNADPGPEARDNVSGLAPYHRHRLVLETETLRAVLDAHGPHRAEKFVQEVCWRTYWKGWLEIRPGVWRRCRDELDRERPAALVRAIETAEAGATGIEGFDDWAREIVDTGMLHNHARMWFASIWIFTLRLPWQAGADFFMRHLMCGDPASNTLSWRWVAGLQTRGKTYLATRENIERHTGGRFAPEGLATRAEPIEEPGEEPRPRPLPPRPHAPPPGPALLLALEDDLHPESWPLDGVEVAGVLVAPTADARSLRPLGAAAAGFAAGAARDAASRASERFRAEAAIVPLEGDALVAAAARANVRRIVAMAPPVGPAADRLDRARPALGEAGIELVELRRSWDEAAWPHATRGYFAFRTIIPELLAREGLLPEGTEPGLDGARRPKRR